jgi:outer membrane protein TolC
MATSKRAICVVTLTATVAVSALLAHLPRAAEAAAPRANSPAALKLQQEQINALQQAANMAKQLLEHGLGPAEDVNRLNHKLMETRLRMAASAKERADILSDALAAAKGQDEFLAKQFKAGFANDVSVQEAKAYRLNIEEMICVEAGK